MQTRSRSRELHGIADEAAVVDHVVVAEFSALGRAGGSAGVLDVDGVVGPEAGFAGTQLGGRDALALGEHFAPAQHAGGRIASDVDDLAEIGQVFGLQLARDRGVELGSKLAQGIDVVAVAEGVLHHKSLAAGLLEDKSQFVGAEAEIEVDEHDAGLGGGELHQHPLRDVGGPDADTVAAGKSQGHQAAGGALHLGVQLAPGKAQSFLAEDERGRRGIAGRHLVQHLADAEIEQRRMVRRPGSSWWACTGKVCSHRRQTPFRANAPPRFAQLIVNGKIIRGAYSVLNFWNTASG